MHVRRIVEMLQRGQAYRISRIMPDGRAIEIVGAGFLNSRCEYPGSLW